METLTVKAPVSKAALWTGRVLSTLAVLMLCFSGIVKLIRPAGFAEEFARLGYLESHALGIGILELVCTSLYVIPQTSVLGAVLLTGYLGGATATHVRISDPYYGPVIFGIAIWLGLYLRDRRLRELLPLRRRPGREQTV